MGPTCEYITVLYTVVGALDGDEDGMSETDGAKDGMTDGTAEGCVEGRKDGVSEGRIDGMPEGKREGDSEGWVGWEENVGDVVGPVGASVGVEVSEREIALGLFLSSLLESTKKTATKAKLDTRHTATKAMTIHVRRDTLRPKNVPVESEPLVPPTDDVPFGGIPPISKSPSGDDEVCLPLLRRGAAAAVAAAKLPLTVESSSDAFLRLNPGAIRDPIMRPILLLELLLTLELPSIVDSSSSPVYDAPESQSIGPSPLLFFLPFFFFPLDDLDTGPLRGVIGGRRDMGGRLNCLTSSPCDAANQAAAKVCCCLAIWTNRCTSVSSRFRRLASRACSSSESDS